MNIYLLLWLAKNHKNMLFSVRAINATAKFFHNVENAKREFYGRYVYNTNG